MPQVPDRRFASLRYVGRTVKAESRGPIRSCRADVRVSIRAQTPWGGPGYVLSIRFGRRRANCDDMLPGSRAACQDRGAGEEVRRSVTESAGKSPPRMWRWNLATGGVPACRDETRGVPIRAAAPEGRRKRGLHMDAMPAESPRPLRGRQVIRRFHHHGFRSGLSALTPPVATVPGPFGAAESVTDPGKIAWIAVVGCLG